MSVSKEAISDIDAFIHDQTEEGGDLSDYCDDNGLELEFTSAAVIKGSSETVKFLLDRFGHKVSGEIKDILTLMDRRLEEELDNLVVHLEE